MVTLLFLDDLYPGQQLSGQPARLPSQATMQQLSLQSRFDA